MRVVIQRTRFSAVHIEGQPAVRCNQGLTILLGVGKGDSEKDADFLAAKISKLRIFEDENGKMNLSIKEVSGECLIVSQFTLYGDCRKGNRPGFDQAADPATANRLYEYFVGKVKSEEILVHTGTFQAEMGVELWNDGPVTFILESPGPKNETKEQ